MSTWKWAPLLGLILGAPLEAEVQLDLPEGRYRGETQDGRPHGAGKLIYFNRQEYEGQFVRGLPHGTGTYRWLPDGEEASGRFKEGEAVGEFSVAWEDKGTYIGEIRLRPPADAGLLPHGNGRRRYVSGSEYSGSWRLGQRHGEGMLKNAQGERYEGEWYADLRHGQGSFWWVNGDTYEGTWRGDQPNGQGIFRWANGETYAGRMAQWPAIR